MKKWNLLVGIVLAVFTLGLSACDDDKEDNEEQKVSYKWSTDKGIRAVDHLLFTDGREDPNGKEIGSGDQELVFTGKQTLKKGKYLLKGWIYVKDGAELTIEAGTIIKGDKQTKAALIIEPGGKIHATGTASDPIIFTSEEAPGKRRPGDWGGVIICGNAENNEGIKQIEGGPRTTFGGSVGNDNSGELQYVRIEFPGYPFRKDQEINGLTMGSVGSGTKIDHIQVSYSNDDSYEWFGGSVNPHHLIAYHGWDDDFDTDNGFSGKVQFCLSVRNPRIADGSQSNGFESDNKSDGGAQQPFTTAVFSNVTLIGPMVEPTFKNTSDYITAGDMFPNNGSELGRFQSAMQIRRESHLSCYNSVAVGWPIGLMIDNQKGDCRKACNDGKINIKNVWFAGMGVLGTDFNKIYEDKYITQYKPKVTFDESKESFSSTFFKSFAGNKTFPDWSSFLFDTKNADNGYRWIPKSGSPLLSAGNFDFDALKSGFKKVTYIGAFSAGDNWLDGWTNFDPQNTVY